MATLAVVERESTHCKTGKVSRENSFYLSNMRPDQVQPKVFSTAIRQHWNIEADHWPAPRWVRDCTFRKDRIKCKESARSKTLASIISIAGDLLRQQKKGSLKAMQENLACNPKLAIRLFKHHDLL